MAEQRTTSESAGGTPRPSSGSERDEAVERLCEAFASDALHVAEFERRVELAHAAETSEELRELLADLPRSSGAVAPRAGHPVASEREASTTASPRGADRLEGLHVPESSVVMGLIGGASRKGRWVPARRTNAIGIMGGVELDLREAVLPPGVTEIRCFAFWGGVEIIVPPDVAVECDGMGIMGGFEHLHDTRLLADPDAPVIRIRGVALMGGVEVQSRYAGESSRDARRRRKRETKERKRLRGRSD